MRESVTAWIDCHCRVKLPVGCGAESEKAYNTAAAYCN